MATPVRQIMVASLLVGAFAVRAGSCDEVVEATIEEMRAGAGMAWNADMAALARAAAGAACVKAQSGRYAATGAAEVDVESAEDAASPAGGSDKAAADAAASDSDEANSLWPFNPGAVKAITGSPGKKPYARRRGD